MASGTKIVFQFGTASGTTTSHSYPYGDDDASVSYVKGYMNTAIANKEAFHIQPVSIKGAKTVITTESPFDLSD